MQSSKTTIFVVGAAVVIFGAVFCLFQRGYFDQAPTTFAPLYPAVTANGDVILGVFEGRVPYTGPPCDICEKVKTAIVLYQNPETKAPATYWFGRVSVDGGNDREVIEGSWTIRRGIKDYPAAVVYVLDANTPEDMRLYWKVNEDILLPLDHDLSPKVGNAAWGYMLSRYAEPYGPRTYK